MTDEERRMTIVVYVYCDRCALRWQVNHEPVTTIEERALAVITRHWQEVHPNERNI